MSINQRGDTIIEVLIVLAVLGLAIGISYATANRSLLNARQAQENSHATEIAQSQVEQIVAIGCTSRNPACSITNPANPGYKLLHPPGKPFCIVAGSVKASTDAGCQDATLPGSIIQISCLNSCAPPQVFEVKVSWDDVLGQGTDTVTQDYTLPQ
jgi:prepilin-type N-terminal cleavage/methylation domain-containing protein